MTARPVMEFEPGESGAIQLDEDDKLAHFRGRFAIPRDPSGVPLVYLSGNSLGLMPLAARELVNGELDDWGTLGVEGHLDGSRPWFSYHEQFRESGARLVGALPGEVVMMNSLTVNLHLMLVTFFQPKGRRHKILMEANSFPSDRYAITTHLRTRGLDPAESLIEVSPREGEDCLRTGDIEEILADMGGEIALVLLSGVQYYTGQFFDLQSITLAARAQGCRVGYDLAHAAGNVALSLHDWDVDFAVWCSYKYLNAGPGAIAGCFVHERHGNASLPRYAGWWGNDPASRFLMDQERDFVPRPGADGWQLSNPPILAMAPLLASLRVFDEAGMSDLRHKSVRLTAYLEYLLDQLKSDRFQIITPREPGSRGCQLSLRIAGSAGEIAERLRGAGVLCDYRPPDTLRVAPVPLYNSYHDVWRFSRHLGEALA